MALRDFVTGRDMCTPDDGAGPSNAAATLANSLLGRSAKDQERLRELPGVQGLPGPSVYGGGFAPTVDSVAQAAAEGGAFDIPGAARPAEFAGNNFLREFEQHEGVSDQYQHFDNIFEQGRQRGALPGPGFRPPDRHETQLIEPCLQSFMASGRAQADFQPMPLPQLRLSVEDQCRLRDRSTIMARQMYATQGSDYADAQVGKLLFSLNIDPMQLPSGPAGAQDWERLYAQGGRHMHMQQPSVAADVAAGQLAANAGPHNDWANQFSNMRLEPAGPPSAWANEFAQADAQRQRWADEFVEQQPGHQWANDFERTQTGATASVSGTDQQGNAASNGDTKALADLLSKDANPKMKNSKFLQFISKMSRGEIIVEDNQAKEVPGAAVGNNWASEFDTQQEAQNHEDVWKQFNGGPADQWANQFAAGTAEGDWADQFANQFADGTDPNQWMEEFAQDMDARAAAAEAGLDVDGIADGYVFKANNPFLDDLHSFAKAKSLFRHGILSEAVYALEAEVQRKPGNVDAWRLLGTVHAENDDDTQAIAAMAHALKADPTNAEVLLSLGVSYTNELDQRRALSYLHTWLANHAKHGPQIAGMQHPDDNSQRLQWVVSLFEQAAAAAPADADVQAALGVLYNLSRNYDRAITAFRTALQVRPQDYSLWNKLGATLANSSQSGEAITAYQKALDLKPNYMRAWTNMGISQANVGNYDASARYYVRALSLNPQAANVWGYLRTSLACSGKVELMPAVDEEDLQHLQMELPIE
ncbi:hypothetical protein WJX82_005278 [Trebouxia sp. C0006]